MSPISVDGGPAVSELELLLRSWPSAVDVEHGRRLLRAIFQAGVRPQTAVTTPLVDRAHAVAAAFYDKHLGVEHLVWTLAGIRRSLLQSAAEQSASPGAAAVTAHAEALDLVLTEALSAYVQKADESRQLSQAVLAHDLRTPLAAVVNSAEVILHSISHDPAVRQSAESIYRAGTRMRELIDDLLAATRHRLTHKLPHAFAEVDLKDGLQQLRDELRAALPAVSIDWQLKGCLQLYGDRRRIAQLLTNLVSNAAEHGYRGQPVAVKITGLERHVRMDVHNFGEPIAPEHRTTMFAPLATTAPDPGAQSTSSGLGLGLFIARQIVDAHLGAISIRSDELGGTVFSVLLPRTRLHGFDTG